MSFKEAYEKVHSDEEYTSPSTITMVYLEGVGSPSINENGKYTSLDSVYEEVLLESNYDVKGPKTIEDYYTLVMESSKESSKDTPCEDTSIYLS